MITSNKYYRSLILLMKMRETLVRDLLIGLEGTLKVSRCTALTIRIDWITDALFMNMRIITIRNSKRRIVRCRLPLMISPVKHGNLLCLVLLPKAELIFCCFGSNLCYSYLLYSSLTLLHGFIYFWSWIFIHWIILLAL